MWPVSTIKKLIYIANARLPTEKAHGFQIVKMCEAFVQNGVQVLLMHPFRYQSDSLKGQSIFEYYSVPRIFEAHRLFNLDIIRLEKLIPKRITVSSVFVHAMLWGLYAALKARRLGADLYYTRDVAVAYWLVRFKLPTVYEAHAIPKRAQKMLLVQLASQRKLIFVAVLTSFIKEQLLKIGFPVEKIVVHPDGADLSLFANLPNKEKCRQILGLPQSRPIIGYIGRFKTLDREKGIPELVQAAAELPLIKGEEPLILCVGGPMSAVAGYLRLAQECGVSQSRLKFVDRVPNREIPLWIRAFDLAVAPFPNSEHYAYFMSPLKLFEYMAGGTPILTTDLPSIREVLKHGETGWLIEPGSPRELATGICDLLCNNALKNAIATAAQIAASKFSWRQRVTEILNEVAAIS
jgi:glycosyltransferase involved in cell wall biosynthesis